MNERRSDWIRTQPALPSFVFHIALIGLVAAAALLLIPVTGWQIAAVVAATLGVILPQTFAAWLAIVCIAVGILINEPSVWRAMVAVLVVHICHVLASLLLAIPIRARVVLGALRPTLRRVLLVQLIAQPLTLIVMLAVRAVGDARFGIGAMEVVPIAGAGAFATFAILVLARMKRMDRSS